MLSGCMECDKGRLTGIADNYQCARCSEITRLRALVEKRERQIVWCVRNARIEENPFDGGSYVDWPGRGIDSDMTDTDMLAAIDEATGERGE